MEITNEYIKELENLDNMQTTKSFGSPCPSAKHILILARAIKEIQDRGA